MKDEIDGAARRFVISGLSRLTVPVAKGLAAKGEVVVLAKLEQRDSPYARLLDSPGITIVYDDDCMRALRDSLTPQVECVLALADDDKQNFYAAADCYELDPSIPVVLRTLDSTLADGFEQIKDSLNVRRAYDMSALSAPAFVALALSDEEFIATEMTMRFGPDEIPLCRLKIHKGSALRRMTPRQLQLKRDCAVVARRGSDGTLRYSCSGDTDRLAIGDEVIIGGPLRQVFGTARCNSTQFPPPKTRVSLMKRRLSATQWKLLKFAVPPVVILVVSIVVLRIAFELGVIDALYQMIVTAAGERILDEKSLALKLFAFASIVAWAILGGILVSFITDEVLERRLGKRPDDLRDHAVVGGLGDVGYRVAKLLAEIDVPTVVVASSDGRFGHYVDWDVPVLNGNIQLAEDLKQAGIDRASCLIAVTTDDLVNIEACVQAERLNAERSKKNSRQGIRTIARLFDEELDQRFNFKSNFGIDEVLPAVGVAAAAFIDAATNDDALRPFSVFGDPFVGLRYAVTGRLGREQIKQWTAQGMTLLAFRQGTGEVKGPSGLPEDLHEGDSLIVVGPEHVVRALASVGRVEMSEPA
ncbi:MAG: NAD-binding protein [Egibacteraceae bacterium]